jgi:hypothetical protein
MIEMIINSNEELSFHSKPIIELMDIYLLARLFRSYQTEKRAHFGNVNVQNAIIYTGLTHTKNINQFILSLKDDAISHQVYKDNPIDYHQCIQVPVIDTPFGVSLSFYKNNQFINPIVLKMSHHIQMASPTLPRISQSYVSSIPKYNHLLKSHTFKSPKYHSTKSSSGCVIC